MSASDSYYNFLLLCLSGRVRSLPTEPGWRWEEFIQTASNEILVPTIYSLLEKAGLVKDLPADVADFFFAARELNRRRNAAITERVRVIAEAANPAGVEPLLLKGFAYVLAGVYQDSADRFLMDIDLLVRKDQIPATLNALGELGYCFDEADPVDRATNHTCATMSRSDSMTIDVHQTMGLGASSRVLSADEALTRSTSVMLDGSRVRILCPEDLVTHHILHSQVHELYRDRIWTPLRSIHDLALLQQRFGAALDWQQIARRFRKRRLYGTLVLFLLQARETIGLQNPLLGNIGPLLRLRWWHRQLLRRRPQFRFVDPCWFYYAGCVPRTRRLRDILRQPGGLRYLIRKLFSVDFFARLKADLS